jgi:hypothetical protein
MSQYFRKLIDQAQEQLSEAEAQPEANPRLLNEARMAIFSAEQMLTQHPDCAKDKSLHFAFKAHLGRARKAVTMIWAEPRLVRDDKRQAGTRKPRLPDVDDWLDRQLSRDQGAKSPALWARFEAHYESMRDDPPIGIHRFKKRVTASRQRLGISGKRRK